MKSFGSYISKYLVSFVAFILILLFLNAVVFGLTFQKIVTEDYGDSSPQAMLEMTATAATPEQLSDEAVQMLRQNHIWAIYLNTDGQCILVNTPVSRISFISSRTFYNADTFLRS